MDKIILEDLKFYAHHGFFDDEKKMGQNFIVSVVMEADTSRAIETDELDFTADYGYVYEIVHDLTVNHTFDLIETLAERICEKVLEEFCIVSAVTVRVDKPQARGKQGMFHAAVEVRREQK